MGVTILKFGANGIQKVNTASDGDTIDLSKAAFTATTGTSPFTVVSTTKVENLNASLLDGHAINTGENDIWLGSTVQSQINSAIAGLDAQESVLDIRVDEPVSPSAGDRYIVATGATGTNWTGHDDDIAEFNGTDWVFSVANDGTYCYVEDVDKFYIWREPLGEWVVWAQIVDHDSLNGLSGGASSEYYHLTNAQHSALTSGIYASDDGLVGGSYLHLHNADSIDDSTSTNKFYSANTAQNDVAGLLTDTNTIDFTYTANSSIAAAVRFNGTGTGANLSSDTNGLNVAVVLDAGNLEVNASNEIAIISGGVGATELADGIDASAKSFNAASVGGASVGSASTDIWLGSTISAAISSAAEGAGFQRESVLDVESDSDNILSPSTGDRYIVGDSALNDFVGRENEIATWSGSEWTFETPVGGWQIRITDSASLDVNEIYYYTGTEWTESILPIAEEQATSAVSHIKRYVIGAGNDPADFTPTTGDRYFVVDDTPVGDWAGKGNNIAEKTSTGWNFEVVNEGDLVKLSTTGETDENYQIIYMASAGPVAIFDEFIRKEFTYGPLMTSILSSETGLVSGTYYIIADDATGTNISSHQNEIGHYDSVNGWNFDRSDDPFVGTPGLGFTCPVLSEGRAYYYNGTTWVALGSNISDVDADLLTNGGNANSLHTHYDVFSSGEAIDVGDILAIDSNGDVVKAQASTTADFQVIGIAASVATGTGQDVDVVTWNKEATISTTFTASDVKKVAYLDATTAGALTLTPPTLEDTVIHPVGILTDTNKIMFKPTTTPILN